MDGKRYNQLVDKLFTNLNSMKEDLEVVIARPYFDGNRLDAMKVNISKNINQINYFKIGLSKSCKFYNGLEDLHMEYSNFKKELNSNYNKIEEA